MQDHKHQHLQPFQHHNTTQHILQLNWSHFKAEFSGKRGDAEAHLPRTNDWIDMHQFQEGVKVQRFCLTLIGEAKLWYESLRPYKRRLARPAKSVQTTVFKKGNIREQ